MFLYALLSLALLLLPFQNHSNSALYLLNLKTLTPVLTKRSCKHTSPVNNIFSQDSSGSQLNTDVLILVPEVGAEQGGGGGDKSGHLLSVVERADSWPVSQQELAEEEADKVHIYP